MTSFMAACHGTSSVSSSSITPRWAYDVFLSFRGKDTRKTFTAHLYAALLRNGINTFIDNKLRCGEEISPTLLKAIEESQISIIVLSKNYASSGWCLDELMKILECRNTREQQVLPLFYDVDPWEVRHRTNCVEIAFAKLKEKFKDDQPKLKRWEIALVEVANLSGRPLENRNEAEFIQSIIEWVNSILVKKTYFQVAKYPIGIDSRVQDMIRLLDIEKNDITRMVGIFGTGGIGKTTLAKAIYNSIASQFEGSCFLENIRETFNQMDGLMILQNKLLSQILGDSSLMVDNVDRGIILIQDRLRSLRVLLVLDDVNQLDQLEKLVGKDDWFGLGSRIIITTRNKRLLNAHGVYSTYQMNGLNHDEALKLFSWNAFKINDKPNDDFVELINDVVHYAGGLPLALTVIGSALKGGDILYWKSKLDEYKKIPHHDIQKILRISFDGLDENTKNIFLDIACFFKGGSVEYVTEMLDGCGFHSYSGIEELKDKCLITQSCYGLLEMHDLLQEMGREIVRQESPKEPGQRSRLWFHEDVRHVLEENTGTNEVEGILVNLPNRDPIHLSPKAFKKMKSLKMFINNNACFSGEPNFLSNELRVLDWPTYPGEYFPSNFCGKKLAILRMPFSRLKELKGVQNSQNLTILDFNGCEFLKEIPDVSRIPNLQKLDLACCGNLVKIDHSVGFLDKLVCLNLFCCSNLMDFPRSLKLRSLKSLCLWGCLSLKNFSKIECQMEYLEKINFTYMGAEELPSSIGCLVGVKELYLGGCTNLMDLSDGIYQLQHLECLSLQGCSEVVEFLKKVADNGQSLPSIVYTKESEISSEDELHQLSSPTNTSDSDDGCSWITFSKLPELEHSNYAPLESNFLKTFVCCSTLTILNLSASDIVALPSCIRKFVGLKILYMEDCKQLQEIQGLPPNVEVVHAKGCLSLEILLEEPTKSPCFNIWDPPELVGDGTVFAALQLLSLRNNVETESYYPISLRVLDLSSSRIVTLPSCIRKFVGLKKLYLNDCKKLQEIRDLPPNVEYVSAKGCLSPEIFLEDIWDTPEHVGDGTMFAALQLLSLRNSVETESYYPISLRVLDLSSSSIVTLPSCVKKFVGVEKLYLEDCKQLQEIRGLPLNVEEVHAKGCLSLEIFLEEPTKSQYLSLGVLDLSSSPIVTLPSCIRKFVGLFRLYLDNCKQLRDIRGLPPHVWQVYARGCTSLEKNQFSWKCIFDY